MRTGALRATRTSIAAAALLVTLAARTASATGNTCTWNAASGGDWGDAANWACTPGGTTPGAADTAIFPALASSVTVTITGAQSVGTLMVDERDYAFVPSGNATLSIGAAASFEGLSYGTDTFTLPLSIGAPVTFSTNQYTEAETDAITFTPGGSLTLEGAVFVQGLLTGPGKVVVSSGNPNLAAAANDYDGGTQIVGGTLSASDQGVLGSGPIEVTGDGGLTFTVGSWTVPTRSR